MREAMMMYKTNPLFKFIAALVLFVVDTLVVKLAYCRSNSSRRKRFWYTVVIGIILETVLGAFWLVNTLTSWKNIGS